MSPDIARRADPAEAKRRHLRLWLWSGAGLTFLIVVIGGITRLTQSGLSIVDWDPILGVIPPLSANQWEMAFARYREFPEYRELRTGMTLSEFRFIYYWEYLHRLAARTIGLLFVVPFLWFWWRGYLDPPLRRRLLLLFALGGLQGFLGWFMVMSGLVDEPRVSQYRLALHLGTAITIFALCIWIARDLSPRRSLGAGDEARSVRHNHWVYLVGVLLALQIVWGAFVAGLDAGFIHNTFPRMGQGLIPPNSLRLEPAVRNLTENPATVQWVHRMLGTLLLLTAAAAVLGTRRRRGDAASCRLALGVAVLVSTQFALGVMTLLRHVPLALGVAHQALALVIVAVWLIWLHLERQLQAGMGSSRRSATARH